MKTVVGLIYGGKSSEHEVSIKSAINIVKAIDELKYTIVLIFVDKQGVWHIKDDINSEFNEAQMVSVVPGSSRELCVVKDNKVELIKLDVAFPIIHGPNGEDGSLQGLLQLAGIPYVGPGVLSSAVCMDKAITKKLLLQAGIAVAPFMIFKNNERSLINYDEIYDKLGPTLFVKPANQGSSVGVNRVSNATEFSQAIKEAFEHDNKLVIETAIDGSEIECAVLGNNEPKASVIGRITPRHNDFYSYEAKYIENDGASLEVPALLDENVIEKVRDLALEVYDILGCKGMARVDMFLKTDDTIIVNEVNTLPGFTEISMYPALWQASGLSYEELVSRLIDQA